MSSTLKWLCLYSSECVHEHHACISRVQVVLLYCLHAAQPSGLPHLDCPVLDSRPSRNTTFRKEKIGVKVQKLLHNENELAFDKHF